MDMITKKNGIVLLAGLFVSLSHAFPVDESVEDEGLVFDEHINGQEVRQWYFDWARALDRCIELEHHESVLPPSLQHRQHCSTVYNDLEKMYQWSEKNVRSLTRAFQQHRQYRDYNAFWREAVHKKQEEMRQQAESAKSDNK
jgi:hypothetical protein